MTTNSTVYSLKLVHKVTSLISCQKHYYGLFLECRNRRFFFCLYHCAVFELHCHGYGCKDISCITAWQGMSAWRHYVNGPFFIHFLSWLFMCFKSLFIEIAKWMIYNYVQHNFQNQKYCMIFLSIDDIYKYISLLNILNWYLCCVVIFTEFSGKTIIKVFMFQYFGIVIFNKIIQSQ